MKDRSLNVTGQDIYCFESCSGHSSPLSTPFTCHGVFIFVFFFAGPEITDELVKLLRKRLDETTLDIITVILVRNCKLTPSDVEVNAVRSPSPRLPV